jgi:hypothetical protein
MQGNTRPCTICGKEHNRRTARYAKLKTCSPECHLEARRRAAPAAAAASAKLSRKVKPICGRLGCDNPVKEHSCRYCCRACELACRGPRIIPADKKRPRAALPICACDGCDKPVVARDRIYCSHWCAMDMRRMGKTPPARPARLAGEAISSPDRLIPGHLWRLLDQLPAAERARAIAGWTGEA